MAPDRLPFSACPTTSPLFRSSTRLKPAAIPVIDGCGVFILRRAMFLLGGLGLRRPVKALRAVFRRCPLRVPRFLERHSRPICLADRPRLRRAAKNRFQAEGTRLRLASGIKVGQLLTFWLFPMCAAAMAIAKPSFYSEMNIITFAFRTDYHITPAQTGHVRLCFMHCLQIWRKRCAPFMEW